MTHRIGDFMRKLTLCLIALALGWIGPAFAQDDMRRLFPEMSTSEYKAWEDHLERVRTDARANYLAYKARLAAQHEERQKRIAKEQEIRDMEQGIEQARQYQSFLRRKKVEDEVAHKDDIMKVVRFLSKPRNVDNPNFKRSLFEFMGTDFSSSTVYDELVSRRLDLLAKSHILALPYFNALITQMMENGQSFAVANALNQSAALRAKSKAASWCLELVRAYDEHRYKNVWDILIIHHVIRALGKPELIEHRLIPNVIEAYIGNTNFDSRFLSLAQGSRELFVRSLEQILNHALTHPQVYESIVKDVFNAFNDFRFREGKKVGPDTPYYDKYVAELVLPALSPKNLPRSARARLIDLRLRALGHDELSQYVSTAFVNETAELVNANPEAADFDSYFTALESNKSAIAPQMGRLMYLLSDDLTFARYFFKKLTALSHSNHLRFGEGFEFLPEFLLKLVQGSEHRPKIRKQLEEMLRFPIDSKRERAANEATDGSFEQMLVYFYRTSAKTLRKFELVHTDCNGFLYLLPASQRASFGPLE